MTDVEYIRMRLEEGREEAPRRHQSSPLMRELIARLRRRAA